MLNFLSPAINNHCSQLTRELLLDWPITLTYCHYTIHALFQCLESGILFTLILCWKMYDKDPLTRNLDCSGDKHNLKFSLTCKIWLTVGPLFVVGIFVVLFGFCWFLKWRSFSSISTSLFLDLFRKGCGFLCCCFFYEVVYIAHVMKYQSKNGGMIAWMN